MSPEAEDWFKLCCILLSRGPQRVSHAFLAAIDYKNLELSRTDDYGKGIVTYEVRVRDENRA